MTWQRDAACAATDPALFYDPSSERAAKAICAACPVRDDCLAHALAHDEQGVWGGLSENERRHARRRGRLPRLAICYECHDVFQHPDPQRPACCSTDCYTTWRNRQKHESSLRRAGLVAS